MFYAEYVGNPEKGEEFRILERGVFLTIEEFVPYRKLGWSGTEKTNAVADAYIKQEQAALRRAEGK